MRFNVKEIDSKYDFEITGMSYIGNPKDATCLFVVGKIKRMITNLEGHRHCLVFIDSTIEIPDDLAKNNCFFVSSNPQAEYGRFSLKMKQLEQQRQANREYRRMQGGYCLGEGVILGKNVKIEPGCLIDHDVVIGDNSYIGYGSIIRNSVVGTNFQCHEYTVIGTESFNLGSENGHSYRIPSFGMVIIGDYVDIGAGTIIERGFNGNTVIEDDVKIDSGVMIGHDAILGENTRITCGACIAGRVAVGKAAYIGMNTTIKQRVSIGENAMVGMGATVIANVKAGSTVFGNPAQKFGLSSD